VSPELLFSDYKVKLAKLGRDTSLYSDAADRANVLAHEGTHGLQIRNGGYGAVSEFEAYQVGSSVNTATGTIAGYNLPVRNNDE
jgi:hypothetical protein